MSALPQYVEAAQERAGFVRRMLRIWRPGEAGTEVLAEEFRVSPLFLRLMWDAMNAELAERGVDPNELAALCRALIDLIDANLDVCKEVRAGVPAERGKEMGAIADQLRDIRAKADSWLRVASASRPPVDWAKVEESLRTGGPAEDVGDVIARLQAGREP